MKCCYSHSYNCNGIQLLKILNNYLLCNVSMLDNMNTVNFAIYFRKVLGFLKILLIIFSIIHPWPNFFLKAWILGESTCNHNFWYYTFFIEGSKILCSTNPIIYLGQDFRINTYFSFLTSHWQAVSHNVVSSSPRYERDSNSLR